MAGNGPDVPARQNDTPAPRTIVFHGTIDAIVHPSKGTRILQHAKDPGSSQTIKTELGGEVGGRCFTQAMTTTSAGTCMLEHCSIDGLGHTWSGGQPAGTFTDAKGPDANAEMVRFFFDNIDKGI